MTNNFSPEAKSTIASNPSNQWAHWQEMGPLFFHMYMVPQSFLNSHASQVKRTATRPILRVGHTQRKCFFIGLPILSQRDRIYLTVFIQLFVPAMLFRCCFSATLLALAASAPLSMFLTFLGTPYSKYFSVKYNDRRNTSISPDMFLCTFKMQITIDLRKPVFAVSFIWNNHIFHLCMFHSYI